MLVKNLTWVPNLPIGTMEATLITPVIGASSIIDTFKTHVRQKKKSLDASARIEPMDVSSYSMLPKSFDIEEQIESSTSKNRK